MGFLVDAVDHTGITVSDLDRSVAFWTEVLGFEVERRARLGGSFAADVTGVPGAEISTAVLSAPGHRIELLRYHSPAGARPANAPDVPGSMHLALRVEDLDGMLAAMARSGWVVPGAARTMTEGPRAGTRFVYLRDPDGTTIELIEPPATV